MIDTRYEVPWSGTVWRAIPGFRLASTSILNACAVEVGMRRLLRRLWRGSPNGWSGRSRAGSCFGTAWLRIGIA